MSLYGGHKRPLALVQITTLSANMATLDNINTVPLASRFQIVI